MASPVASVGSYCSASDKIHSSEATPSLGSTPPPNTLDTLTKPPFTVSSRTRSKKSIKSPVTRPSVNCKLDKNLTLSSDTDDVIEIEPPVLPLSCEDVDSAMNPSKLSKLLEFCNPGCRLVIPQVGERCHRFDSFEPDQLEPEAVLSAAFFRVGVSLPLHPFLTELLNFYQLAPLQLTPNSYRMAIGTYILYANEFSTTLTVPEFHYFYQLKETGKSVGSYYLTAWGNLQGRCIKGSKKEMSGWQKHFLYCYDCQSYRKEFNTSPSKY